MNLESDLLQNVSDNQFWKISQKLEHWSQFQKRCNPPPQKKKTQKKKTKKNMEDQKENRGQEVPQLLHTFTNYIVSN